MGNDREELDNEVARAIIRRRDRIVVLPRDPFEDCSTIFHDGRVTYYIDYRGFHTGDHWQKHHTYFRPAPHLMDTIIDLVREAGKRQDEASHEAKARSIIHA